MQDSNDVRNISIWLGSNQRKRVHSLEESFNSYSNAIALLKDLLNKCVHACLFVSHPTSYRIGSLSSVYNLQLYGCFALYLLILCSRRTLNSQMWFELLWRCFVHIAHPKFAQCLNFWHRAHLHTQMHRHTHT